MTSDEFKQLIGRMPHHLREAVAAANPGLTVVQPPAHPSRPTPSKALVLEFEINLVLPIRLYSLVNQRDWRQNHRQHKAQRQQVRDTLGHLSTLLRRSLPLEVTLTRVAPRLLDNDNLQSSAKAVRDELAAIIGVDDRDPSVVWHPVQQERGGVRQYSTVISIRSVSGRTRGPAPSQ